ncbi:hypothetical protein FHG87_007129 [Trinorchestia longiramus]|nr:hypothetical protein FHG87_007129 [Trinorchestia longiramus]
MFFFITIHLSVLGVPEKSVAVPQASPEPPPLPPPPSSDGSLHEDSADRSTGSSRPPALPPIALDDPPPRPPERPPKKATLRSHFSGQKELPASPSFGSEDVSKFGRPYYYRRPPAPDPPVAEATNFMVGHGGSNSTLESSALSHDPHANAELLGSAHSHSPLQRIPRRSFSHTLNLSSCPSSLPSFSQCSGGVAPLSPTIQGLASQTSRSSTPDLPPPPPLESSEQEVSGLVDEEPLPPPPSDISRSNSKISGMKITFESGPLDNSSSLSGSSDPRSCISYDNTERINSNSLESAFNSAHPEDYNRSSPPPPPKTPPPPLCPSDASQDHDNEQR